MIKTGIRFDILIYRTVLQIDIKVWILILAFLNFQFIIEVAIFILTSHLPLAGGDFLHGLSYSFAIAIVSRHST